MVIDPRYTPDAARADVWLPVRPGTDVAMMLGWTRYIIDKKLYNEEFCSKWTNLPFLVDPSDPAGALLRASKVFADVTAENEGYVYYDEKTGEVTKAFALGPDNEASYNPALFGAYDVTLADGTAIKAKTAFEAYKEQSDEFTIDTWPKCAWLMQATWKRPSSSTPSASRAASAWAWQPTNTRSQRRLPSARRRSTA